MSDANPSFDDIKYWKEKSYSPEITKNPEFQAKVRKVVKQLLLQEAINIHLENEKNKAS